METGKTGGREGGEADLGLPMFPRNAVTVASLQETEAEAIQSSPRFSRSRDLLDFGFGAENRLRGPHTKRKIKTGRPEMKSRAEVC